MHEIKTFLLFLLACICINNNANIGSQLIHLEQVKGVERPIVSIYVHGTLGLRSLFSYIPKAAALTYVPNGLSLISNLSKNTLFYNLAQDFCNGDSRKFCLEHFYAFGWDGHLLHSSRVHAGKMLAKQIGIFEKAYVKVYGIKPIFRVITFSHGGNVALNMADYISEDIQVELVLIACPVQVLTAPKVHAHCFSKIYVISSLADYIQVADVSVAYHEAQKHGLTNCLPKRFFDSNNPKLKQACIAVNNRYLGHLEMLQQVNAYIPYVLKSLDSQDCFFGRNIAHINIQDASFNFLNLFNFASVVEGKKKQVKNNNIIYDVALLHV